MKNQTKLIFVALFAFFALYKSNNNDCSSTNIANNKIEFSDKMVKCKTGYFYKHSDNKFYSDLGACATTGGTGAFTVISSLNGVTFDNLNCDQTCTSPTDLNEKLKIDNNRKLVCKDGFYTEGTISQDITCILNAENNSKIQWHKVDLDTESNKCKLKCPTKNTENIAIIDYTTIKCAENTYFEFSKFNTILGSCNTTDNNKFIPVNGLSPQITNPTDFKCFKCEVPTDLSNLNVTIDSAKPNKLKCKQDEFTLQNGENITCEINNERSGAVWKYNGKDVSATNKFDGKCVKSDAKTYLLSLGALVVFMLLA